MRTILLSAGLVTFVLSGWAYSAVPTNVVIHPDVPGGNPSAANSNTLSPAEWQELRSARMAALKANPSLVTKAGQLNEKLRQFEQKLNAAMVKTDPKIEPVLAKFAGNRPAPHPMPQQGLPPKPQ
jgi:hypothetical protein